MVAPLYTTDSGLLFHAGKILVVTIGLPARGKTHISRALERYLRWMGLKTQVVSLGDYRRKTLGGAQQLPPDYFTLGNKSKETMELRARVSKECEQTIWDYFNKGGQVVIYDANNGTKAARTALAERFDAKGVHVIYLESISDNKDIIEANIRGVKISSPDYRNWDPDLAVKDYYTRIRDHEKYYETVTETDWPFIKIINVGEKIMVNNIQGYVQSRIVFFLMNIHNRYRTIYFARSGQSLIEHSYKADSDLSPAGWEYAEKLKDFVLERRAKNLEARGLDPTDRRLVIWTSTRRRAHHTAHPFLDMHRSPSTSQQHPAPARSLAYSMSAPTFISPDGLPSLHPESDTPLIVGTGKAGGTAKGVTTAGPGQLQVPASADSSPPPRDDVSPSPSMQSTTNKRVPPKVKVVEKPQMAEINPGIWDGLTPDQARKYYAEDWERFVNDPYSFRAPRAESYHDLSIRLEPILIELEREQEDLLIIGHASVIRCLLAYLIGLPASEIPAIEIARGDLLEVVPASYGVHSQAFHFWDGPGRRGEETPHTLGNGGHARDENNFYENYAEDTRGKRKFSEAAHSSQKSLP